jgi:hypothetical protein
MKVPKYIRKKMHQIALYAGLAAKLDREVGFWLGQQAYGRNHENGKPWGVEALVQRLRSFRFCN